MNKKINYIHINSLRGIACVFIMCSHYIALFKYSQDISIFNVESLSLLNNVPLSALFNEGYWLKIFFLISGFVLAMTSIETILDIIKKSIYRFFRFAFPIFFSSCIIYLIYIFIDFHTDDIGKLLNNNWLATFYNTNIYISDILFSPIDILILGYSKINNPFWVLKDMLIASVIIFFLIFLIKKYKKYKNVIIVTAILMVYSFCVLNVAFCIIGFSLFHIYDLINMKISDKLAKLTLFISFIMVFGVQHIIVEIIPYALVRYFVLNDYWVCIYFSLFIILGNRLKILKNRKFEYINKISFGVYALHWPIMCSVGTLLISYLNSYFSLFLSVSISIVVCILITIIFAGLFNRYFESLTNRILNNFNKPTKINKL